MLIHLAQGGVAGGLEAMMREAAEVRDGGGEDRLRFRIARGRSINSRGRHRAREGSLPRRRADSVQGTVELSLPDAVWVRADKFVEATGEGLRTDIRILRLARVHFDVLFGLDLIIDDLDRSLAKEVVIVVRSARM